MGAIAHFDALTIFMRVQLCHLLMQLADVRLDIDVTGGIKFCVAKNFGQGVIVNPQAMPPRCQRIAAAVRVHSALLCADTQAFQRWIIVALAEVSAVDIPDVSGKK